MSEVTIPRATAALLLALLRTVNDRRYHDWLAAERDLAAALKQAAPEEDKP